MNNSKLFKVLYYICFIITFGFTIYSSLNTSNLVSLNNSMFELDFMLSILPSIILVSNLILVIIFSMFAFKRIVNNINIVFPISYLLFFTIVVVIMFMFNDKLIYPYIHYNYYLSFILFNYLLLNLYSILSFEKKI